jgi:phosphoglycerate dehydrogenase-like enzyme
VLTTATPDRPRVDTIAVSRTFPEDLSMSKPVCVVWMNEAKVYQQALARSGLAEKFEVHGLTPDQPIPEDLAARTEALLGWRPASVLKRMPRLRWVQAVTAGVDGWLACPELRDDVTLCCARGSHRISMPENILGAIFHLTKPYMQSALDQRESRWT